MQTLIGSQWQRANVNDEAVGIRDRNAGAQKIRFLTRFPMYWLIYMINNLEEKMRGKAGKYAEETNPRRDGQYKGQASNSNILERRLCHRHASCQWINVERFDVKRSLEKFMWQQKRQPKYERLQNFSANVKTCEFIENLTLGSFLGILFIFCHNG